MANESAPTSIRWQFVEGYEAESSHWSWRIVNVDGSMDSQSPPFGTYGLAVSDAIRSGFQPRQQHWVVATRHTVTHFRPGQPPLTVPVEDRKSTGGDGKAQPRHDTLELPPEASESDGAEPSPTLPRNRREAQ